MAPAAGEAPASVPSRIERLHRAVRRPLWGGALLFSCLFLGVAAHDWAVTRTASACVFADGNRTVTGEEADRCGVWLMKFRGAFYVRAEAAWVDGAFEHHDRWQKPLWMTALAWLPLALLLGARRWARGGRPLPPG